MSTSVFSVPAPSSLALNASSIFNALTSSLELQLVSPGLGLFLPLVLVAGIICSSADFFFLDSGAEPTSRLMEAFSAAISALSEEAFEILLFGSGVAESEREGISGSRIGS